MSIPSHDPIYGRHYVLAVAPHSFYGVFTTDAEQPPFRECSLRDLYAHVFAAQGAGRLTIPQDEMEGYYKARGWAMYRLGGEDGNLLRIV